LQKMLTTASVGRSRIALISSMTVASLVGLAYFLIGAGLYVFYSQHPEKNGMAAKVSASGRAEIMSRILLRPGMLPLPARLPVCRMDDTGSVALPAGRPPARRGNIRAMPSESVYP
jgi:hypothetical protein